MPGSTSISGIGKSSDSCTTADSVAASMRAGGERLEDADPQFRQRTRRKAGDLVRRPRLDRIGHVQARHRAPGRRTTPCRGTPRTPCRASKRISCGHDVRAARGNGRDIGLRRPPISRWTAAVMAARHAVGRWRGRGRARRSTGPTPTGCSRARRRSTAARLMAARPGTSGRAARLGDASPRATRAISVEVADVQPVNERAEIRPLPHASASGTVVAEQRPRARGLDLEIRMHHDGRQSGRAPAAGRCPADWDGARARSRRRSPARCCRDAPPPAPRPSPIERAANQRVDRRAVRRSAR